MNCILAKPNGITLEEHVNNLMRELVLYRETFPLVFAKYEKLTGVNLYIILIDAVLNHDNGKANEIWQKACLDDYKEFLSTGVVTGSNLMVSGVRHEIDSVKSIPEKNDIVKASIVSHHGKLSFNHEHRWENDKDLWKHFLNLSDESILCKTLEHMVKLKYQYSVPRSILKLLDHRASAIEAKQKVPSFTKFRYKFPYEIKNSIQQIVINYFNDDMLVLRAKTGGGKTDASLLWAKHQIDTGKAERVIIALPTRFTSNALSINVSKDISETGLYHSSAWYNKFHGKVKLDKSKRNEYKMEHEYARLLQTPLTVVTIDHLLMCLTTTKEDHHDIFSNIAHSCIIIDEADFYDEFIQANISALLKITKILDIKIMIMSASIPDIALEMYRNTGYNPRCIVEDVEDYNEVKCKLIDIIECENLCEISHLLELALTKPTIIYANTINRAKAYYYALKALGAKPILYHSQFLETDKVEIEKKLINSLGKSAWENGTANGIAILTQIGEMSINISSELMISDLCPIDRLDQRCGRLDRFNLIGGGDLHIIIPLKNNVHFPLPYGNYDKVVKRFVSNTSLIKTKNILELNKKYSVGDFVKMNNEIYSNLNDFSGLALKNSSKLIEQFKDNWLILPKYVANDDLEETNVWKSRNIPQQVNIFIITPEEYLKSNGITEFKSYADYNYYKNLFSISVMPYLLSNNNNIFKHTITLTATHDTIDVICINDGMYNSETGLSMSIELSNIL